MTVRSSGMTVVGIDLGTTNSLVAVMGPEGPETIANELGDHLTPSVVAIAEDGGVLVGRAAKDRLVAAPDSGRAFFKRDMGTPTTYRFGKRTWTPTECSAQILAEMARIAEVHLGEKVDQVVVTVPAYFHDAQRTRSRPGRVQSDPRRLSGTQPGGRNAGLRESIVVDFWQPCG